MRKDVEGGWHFVDLWAYWVGAIKGQERWYVLGATEQSDSGFLRCSVVALGMN